MFSKLTELKATLFINKFIYDVYAVKCMFQICIQLFLKCLEKCNLLDQMSTQAQYKSIFITKYVTMIISVFSTIKMAHFQFST